MQLCKHCHDEQTDRQRQAGLIKRRRTAGDPALGLLHALIEGVAGIFSAHAELAGHKQLVRDNERSRRATLRALASLSTSKSPGPSPVSNDRRRRNGKRRQSPGVNGSPEALVGILPALAFAIGELLPDDVELAPGFKVDRLRALLTTAGAGRLAHSLAALESHPNIGELPGIIARDLGVAHVAMAQLSAVEAATAGQLTLALSDFYAMARPWIDALSSLATDNDPAQAFERFLGEAGRSARRTAV